MKILALEKDNIAVPGRMQQIQLASYNIRFSENPLQFQGVNCNNNRGQTSCEYLE